ncbi:MAG: hypothetical protein HQK49_18610 [Oligoflexia bacterium]|nr:hypothetical protein [Oligoflexia bacterium]
MKKFFIAPNLIIPREEIDEMVMFLCDEELSNSLKQRLEKFGYQFFHYDRYYENEFLSDFSSFFSNIYKELLHIIGKKLNELHKENFPLAFWEIPLSIWLMHYICILYDRYIKLRLVKDTFPNSEITFLSCNFTTKLIDSQEELIDFLCVDEKSSSFFWGIVANEMGFKIKYFDYDENNCLKQEKIVCKQKIFSKIAGKIKQIVLKTLNTIFYKKRILVSPNHFYPKDFLSLLFLFNANFYLRNKKVKYQNKIIDRNCLRNIYVDGEFKQILINMLPTCLPKYLVEDFNGLIIEAKKWDKYDVYLTSNDLWNDNLLKYICSLGRIRNATILGWQHGGGYGHYVETVAELVERQYSDYFITWGWDDNKYKGSKIIKLPHPKLHKYRNKHNEKNENLVWVGLSIPKLLYRHQAYPMMPHWMRCYFGNKQKFLHSLEKKIKEKVIYRGYPVNYGWADDEKKIFNEVPNMKFSVDGNLIELMKDSRMLVSDHLGTSIMEALLVNIPLIFFLNYDKNILRESSLSYFNELIDAEIMFLRPEDAALKLNEIYGDVRQWWENPYRQKVKDKFLNRYCLCAKDWIKTWRSEIDKL